MRRIRIPNPNLRASERTFLDADYSSGTSLTVLNNLGFSTNDYAITGEVGEEKTESQSVSSISTSTTITISSSYNFSHNKGTSVYRSEWNQVSIESKTGTGNWGVLILKNIEWDSLETLYIDNTGDDTVSYRFRFYSPTRNIYSEYSPTITGAGFTRYQVGAMIINVRRKLRDPNPNRFSDSEIIQRLQDGQKDIEMLQQELWFLKVDTFEASNGITATVSTSKYSLASYTDLNYLSKIRYRYSTGNITLLWDLEPSPENEFDRYTYNQARPADDNIRRFKILPPDASSAQGYFSIYPIVRTAGVGTFFPVYYRTMTVLDDISDVTDLPFPEILEDYAAWRLHDLIGNQDQANHYRDLYYGPSDASSDQRVTGIAMLEQYNKNKKQVLGYGRQLWRFRGQRGRNNFFGSGITTRDFIKENYM